MKTIKTWTVGMIPNRSDKDCSTGGKWLTDSIITAGQKLLKITCPYTGKVQLPILGDILTFEI